MDYEEAIPRSWDMHPNNQVGGSRVVADGDFCYVPCWHDSCMKGRRNASREFMFGLRDETAVLPNGITVTFLACFWWDSSRPVGRIADAFESLSGYKVFGGPGAHHDGPWRHGERYVNTWRMKSKKWLECDVPRDALSVIVEGGHSRYYWRRESIKAISQGGNWTQLDRPERCRCGKRWTLRSPLDGRDHDYCRWLEGWEHSHRRIFARLLPHLEKLYELEQAKNAVVDHLFGGRAHWPVGMSVQRAKLKADLASINKLHALADANVYRIIAADVKRDQREKEALGKVKANFAKIRAALRTSDPINELKSIKLSGRRTPAKRKQAGELNKGWAAPNPLAARPASIQ